MSVKLIREEALRKLKGNWLFVMVGYVMTLFVTTIVAQLLFSLFPLYELLNGLFDISDVASAVSLAVQHPMQLLSILFVGFVFTLLRASYRFSLIDVLDYQAAEVKDIFQVFTKPLFLKNCQLIIVRSCLIIGWSLLLIVPGIWKAYEYSQSSQLLKRNPDITIKESLTMSSQMMRPQLWTYIRLQLTFILWYLIPVLLYILFIWANWSRVEVGFDMGLDGIAVVFGLAMGILVLFSLMMLVFSFYVEPFKLMSKQVFFKIISDNNYAQVLQQDDRYEKQLIK